MMRLNVQCSCFDSLLQKYQIALEQSIKVATLFLCFRNVFAVSLSRGGSYLHSPKWIKTKKATVNPKNNDENYFQYVIMAALNQEQIKRDPQRLTKIRPFKKPG